MLSVESRVEQALRSEAPVEQLRALAVAMQREGRQPPSVLEFFDKNREALREAGREADEDAVLEVMDFLVGWCSPHKSLAPKQS